MIRNAVEADIQRLLEMALHFVRQTSYSQHIPPNPVQFQLVLRRMMEPREDRHFIVSVKDGLVIGMMAMILTEHPFSGELTATEIFWWMEPDYRGVGVELYRAFEQWAKDKGAKRIQMGAPASYPERKIGKFYERLGFFELETIYQKDVK